MGAHRRRKHNKIQPYRWLGTGALAIGIGAAALTGSGIAYADDASGDSSPASAAADRGKSSAAPRSTSTGSDTDTGTETGNGKDDADEAPDTEPVSETDNDDNDLQIADFADAEDSGERSSIPDSSEDDTAGADDEVVVDLPLAIEQSIPRDGATVTADDGTPSPVSKDVDRQAVVISTVVSIAGADSPPAPSPAAPVPPDDLLAAILRRLQVAFFNESPTAAPEQYAGQSALGAVTGSAGAEDPDGDPLVVTLVAGPQKGTVTVNPDGTYTYTPSKSHALTGGTDTFTVSIAETNASEHLHGFRGLWSAIVRIVTFGAVRLDDGSTIRQTITVSIAKVNFAPTAGPPRIDSVDDETGSVTGTLGFSDDNGDVLSYAVTGAPTRGSVTVTAAGGFTYLPDDNKRPVVGSALVTDSFIVTATDPGGQSGFVTVTVTVVPKEEVVDPNSPPVAGSPAYVYTVDGATGIVRGHLFVSDADDDELTYRLGGGLNSADGSVAVNAATGQWVFRPSPRARLASWSGEHSTQALSIVVSDGSASITVDISAPVTPGFDLQADATPGVAAQPTGVAVSGDGHVYIASSGDGTIRVIRPDGSTAPSIQVGGTIFGLALDDSGRLVLADPGTGAVTVVDPTGVTPKQQIATVAGAAGVAIDASGHIVVSSVSRPTLTVLDGDGTVIDTIALPGAAFGVAAGADGRTYVTVGDSVVVIDGNGEVENTIRPGFGQLYTVAADGRGTLYLTDVTGKLHVVAPGGAVRTVTLGGVSAGVAVTATGVLATDLTGGLTEISFVAPAELGTDRIVNPITGVVAGGTDVLDPGGFRYALGSGPGTQTGLIVVDAETGGWRFTPTPGARHLAQGNPSAASVTFTIVVTGGIEPVVVTITAPIVAAVADDDRVIDPDDLVALSREGQVEVVQNVDGTVRSIDGNFTTMPVRNAEDAAEVFNRIAGLLGYSPGFVGADDFTSYSPEATDGQAAPVYYYLNLTTGGIPLVGRSSGAVLITDANGAVQGVFSGLSRTDDDVDLDPADGFETAGAAEAVAKAALRGQLSEYLSDAELDSYLATAPLQSEQVVYYASPSASGVLTWRVIAYSPPSSDTGEDIPAASFALHTFYVQATGTAAGEIVGQQSAFDGLIASQTVQAEDLHDVIRSIVVSTYSSDGTDRWFHDRSRGISVYRGPSNPKFLPGTKAGYNPANPDKRAVSALANVAEVYDYYRDQLGFTPRGHVFVTVVPTLDESAYYITGTSGSMALVFGDSWESARDVVAHEYTHGLLDYRPGFGRGNGSGLGNTAQAEALEEAFGDILGSLFEAKTTIGLEFLIGDDKVGCGNSKVTCSIRILSDPSIKGDREHFRDFVEPSDLSTYNEYPDSTIFGFAVAKMNSDKRTAAISREQWTQVFGHAIYTLAPNPTFADARDAVVFSAKMFGFNSDQLAAVKKAFNDVGISSGSGSYSPPKSWQGVTMRGAPLMQAPLSTGTFNRDGSVTLMTTYDMLDNTTRVALIDAATGTQFGRTTHITGIAGAKFLADGTHILVTSIDDRERGQIAVIDRWTGNQIGQTVTLSGSIVSHELVNGDSILVAAVEKDDLTTDVVLFDTYQAKLIGTRTELRGRVVTSDYDVALHRAVFQTSRVVNGKTVFEMHLVDTFGGGKVGTAVQLPGQAILEASTDGTRLLAAYRDSVQGLLVFTMDVDTGSQIGGVLSVGGSLHNPGVEVTVTANRAVITTSGEGTDGVLTTRLDVVDLATGARVGSTSSFTGQPWHTAISADGTRALLIRRTYSPEQYVPQYISVINLTSGGSIGTEIAVPGTGHYEVMTIGENWVIASDYDGEFHVAIVNSVTGTQVGSTTVISGWLDQNVARAGNNIVAVSQSASGARYAVVIDGLTGRQVGVSALTSSYQPMSRVVVNADGSRAAITRLTMNSNEYVLEVLDTRTGAIVGAPVRMDGHQSTNSAEFTSDGSRIVMSTSGLTESPLVVVDAATGQELSRLIFATGYGSLWPAKLTPDGRRALVVTYGLSQGQPRRSVSVVDIATGKLIGKTVHLPAINGYELLDAQGRRATLTTYGYDVDNGSSWTEVVVLDMETGKQISPFVRT
ncbi:Ig-like domain-containing protein [Mycobacterium sp. 236(2023)]|uniref:Ig-like domain-containing protein n=1 Tax=Mycobacterium sp. 236(2023) TaxID=3038163 RepID=UPI0024150533|nr:Ig-like domain-containing protein [Mycobacterium sp. 236(2023)]MDG4664258.1 Ig-like domain-containing protein [Mycobacterium sp. 236(2023)]